MSKLRSLFGGTRNYAWFILLLSLTVFAVSFWIRRASVPKPTELENLIAQNEPEDHVHALAAGTNGTSYLGTHMGLVAGKDRKNWGRLPGPTEDILAVQVATDGKLYLGGTFGIVSYTAGQTESLLTGTVGALAADPSDPKRLIAFAKGAGIMESSDSGRTWNRWAEFKGHEILTIAIDPHNSKRVAVAGYNGLLTLSEDGGRTWANAGSLQNTVSSLVFDPSGSGRLWGAIGGVVRYSDDGGSSWRSAGNLPPDRVAVALTATTNPKAPILAATSQGYLFTPSPK